jgi:hypothetical protein
LSDNSRPSSVPSTNASRAAARGDIQPTSGNVLTILREHSVNFREH